MSQESRETTEVVYGEKEALTGYLRFLSNSKLWLDTCGDANAPSVDIGLKEYNDALLDCKARGFRLRYITEITNDNILYCKKLARTVELRHLDRLKANFAVTENQFLTVGSIQEARPIPMSIFSNVRVIVEQQQYLFETLWGKAIPAEERIREVEESKTAERTEVIYGQDIIVQTLGRFLDNTVLGVAIIIPRPEMVDLLERLEIFRRLVLLKGKSAISIKILGAFGDENKATFGRMSPHVQHKSVDSLPMSSIAFVRDGKEILLSTISDQKNMPMLDKAIHSNDSMLAETMMAAFDALWNQVENNERMTEEKNHAELLLDLITHDIGNHNQIVLPSLELTQIKLEKAVAMHSSLNQQDLEELQSHLANATRAFERSMSLVDNIRRLERMYREKDVTLTEQDIVSAVQAALLTVRGSKKHQKEILFSACRC